MTKYTISVNGKYFAGDCYEAYKITQKQRNTFGCLSKLGDIGLNPKPSMHIDKYNFTDEKSKAELLSSRSLSEYVMGILYRQENGFIEQGNVVIEAEDK